MEFFGEVVAWFADPANWSGSDGVPARVGEHLVLSVVPLVVAVAIALPLGAWIGHTGRFSNLVINIANVGRAIPSLAILAIATMLLQPTLVELGLRDISSEIATMIAMAALAIPPILTNAYVGISEVDEQVVEAGRGMGMTPTQVLRRVELPVALPVILVGIRTGAVQVVATATLGAVFATGGLGRYIIDGIAQRRNDEVFAGALIVAALSIATLGAVFATGGLGRYIIDGIAQRRNDEVFAGALIVAALSIATELTFTVIQRWVTSPGLRGPEAATGGPMERGGADVTV